MSLTSYYTKKKSISKLKNSFNIFEIIMTQFFQCCLCYNMKIKNILNENANEILYKKLDIITYVRNMILFDIINEIILANEQKEIINFLCRPIISVKKNTVNEFNEFYRYYKEKNFEIFVNNINESLRNFQKFNN